MRRAARPASPFLAVWRWPIVLAALTMFGLFSALIGEHGIWLWLSWIALVMPLAVILRFLTRLERGAAETMRRCPTSAILSTLCAASGSGSNESES